MPPFGIIEGYFGTPWNWEDRTAVMRKLSQHGFGFFIYAPKADAFLRRRWQEPHPAEDWRALGDFADACRDADVEFGIGLSPFELHANDDKQGRAALDAKLCQLNELRPGIIALLFDDMRGDIADLARRQADLTHAAADITDARIIMCPSYYSDDPVLDRAFGQRPRRYLEDLGAMLDPAVDVFWTGEEVCSREYSCGHLQQVAGLLRRKPFLWDNYPVNDGPRMSRHLHLRGFTGRGGIADDIAGHAINPALQAYLTLAPALTLAASYVEGAAYRYGAAFSTAARDCYGPALTEALEADILTLNDAALERISAERRASLAAKYAAFDHPAAAEVVRFLEGGYAITGEQVQTQ